MSKVRINDLARELEVKSRAILDALTHVGVIEKKTHSSSLEEDEAERVRQHFQRSGKNGAGAARAVDNEPKQKIDWSRVSKPGDVLKAIQQRKDEAAAIAQRPPAPPASQPQAVNPVVPARPVAAGNPAPSAGPGPAVGVPQPPVSVARPAPSAPPATVASAAPNQPATPVQTAPGPGLPGQLRPNLGGQSQRPPAPPPPAPRRIVPLPRQEPRIVV
ncbi:MAG: translation initiation factor IF-2 N-terminal domain-containing protein, partial [Acidobacteriaceae bacterium]